MSKPELTIEAATKLFDIISQVVKYDTPLELLEDYNEGVAKDPNMFANFIFMAMESHLICESFEALPGNSPLDFATAKAALVSATTGFKTQLEALGYNINREQAEQAKSDIAREKIAKKTLADGFKTAERSCGSPYKCVHAWPADCFVQCGDDGIVLPAKMLDDVNKDANGGIEVLAAAAGLTAPQGSYRTAFFEAFPRIPCTFIRGEAATITDAETQAWEFFQKYQACAGHQFEPRGYSNGAGICKFCGMFSSKIN